MRGKNPHEKKYCFFCKHKIKYIDYKNVDLLKHFITQHQKIRPRYYSGVCIRHQKKLSKAIKIARTMALLPYIN